MSSYPNHFPFRTVDKFPVVKVLHHALRAFSGNKISMKEALSRAQKGDKSIALLKNGVWDDVYDFTATFLPLQGVTLLVAKAIEPTEDVAFYEVEKFMELGNEQIGSAPLFFAKNGHISRLLANYIGTENLVAFIDTDDRPAFTSRTADFVDESGNYVYDITQDVGLSNMTDLAIINLAKAMLSSR